MKAVRVLLVLLFTLAGILAAGLYWLQDANNLKPELERLINENSDYVVSINGDMDWQLFPPLHLRMNNVAASGDDLQVNVAELALRLDLSAIWQDINSWQISELHLTDTTIIQPDSRIDMANLDLMGFSLGTPAPFQLTAALTSTVPDASASDKPAPDLEQDGTAPAPPFNISLDGTVAYSVDPADGSDQLKFTDTRFTTDDGRGVCQVDAQSNLPAAPATASALAAAPEGEPAADPVADDETLIPVDTLLAYNFTANCNIEAYTLQGETFTNSRLEAHNADGRLHVMLDTPDFFGGELAADTSIDLQAEPLQWQVSPEVAGVDSERLLAWAEQDLQWVALVAFNSNITLAGNTPAELALSVRAESRFDGGKGSINISKIKQQLAQLALLAGQTDEVAQWPDVWNYEDFTGTWNITGPQHALDFNLDNMQVKADGEYNYLDDTIDMLGHVTVHAAEDSPFNINPMLAGTAIPVRCRGAAADPECKLDENASRNLIARALQRGDDSGLRAKLEQKIDEKVPEEYRETARDLLELLGRSLERAE